MAKRLVDADELKRRMIAFTTGVSTNYLVIENIVMMINQADAVDAVEVVRCRDCTHYDDRGCGWGYCHQWKYEAGMSPNDVSGDDFCSYGERKEG